MSAKKIRRVANKEAKKIIGENLSGQQNVEEQISHRLEIENVFEEFLERNESENERDLFNSDSDCESERNEYSICEELGKWANEYSISFSAFNALLRCLNKCEIKVPKDGRTILKTPTTVDQRKIGDDICQVKYETAEKEVNSVLQKYFVYSNERLKKRKPKAE